MPFQITGLDPAPFRPFYGLDDAALAARGVERHVADTKPGFPDRIALRDAEPGERLLLLNHPHQPADTPYRASHAIFVLEGVERAAVFTDTVPDPLRVRPISLRAYDHSHRMIDADLVDGRELAALIDRMFGDPRAAYLHAHYARRGCYAARIERT